MYKDITCFGLLLQYGMCVTALNQLTVQNVRPPPSEYVLWYDLYNCLFSLENVLRGLPGSCMEPHSHYSYYRNRKPNIFQI